MDAQTRQRLEEAIQSIGGPGEMARRCQVSPQALHYARRTRPSAELAMQMEKATGGGIRAQELRPDLPWPKD